MKEQKFVQSMKSVTSKESKPVELENLKLAAAEQADRAFRVEEMRYKILAAVDERRLLPIHELEDAMVPPESSARCRCCYEVFQDAFDELLALDELELMVTLTP
jgi:hypothetical protein